MVPPLTITFKLTKEGLWVICPPGVPIGLAVHNTFNLLTINMVVDTF